MFTVNSSVYASNYSSRSLCSRKACRESHTFLVGTCSLHDLNEINIIDYQEESNSIISIAAFSHVDHINALETSSHDPDLFISSWLNKNNKYGLTMWRIPPNRSCNDSYGDSVSAINNGGTDTLGKLLEIGSLESDSNRLSIAKWHHMKDTIISSDGHQIISYSISDSDVQVNSKVNINKDLYNKQLIVAPAISWDPHTSGANICATAVGTSLHICDMRKSEIVSSLPQAHDGCIRDLDYNPNKPSTIVTCSDDRKIKFWDVRNLTKGPLKILEGHSSSVNCVRYNPFHDQLLLSGGSDEMVSLWRVASCSSAPWLGGDNTGVIEDPAHSEKYDNDTIYQGTHIKYLETFKNLNDNRSNNKIQSDNDPPDVKVRHIDQHEDSVQCVAWSAADAWIYASASYDGRVIINHVPSTEKYKILL